MKHCAGLNVSVKETAICIVDETGKIVPEATLTTEPEAVIALLNTAGLSVRSGSAGSRTDVAVADDRLARGGAPVVCVETRHMKQS